MYVRLRKEPKNMLKVKNLPMIKAHEAATTIARLLKNP